MGISPDGRVCWGACNSLQGGRYHPSMILRREGISTVMRSVQWCRLPTYRWRYCLWRSDERVSVYRPVCKPVTRKGVVGCCVLSRVYTREGLRVVIWLSESVLMNAVLQCALSKQEMVVCLWVCVLLSRMRLLRERLTTQWSLSRVLGRFGSQWHMFPVLIIWLMEWGCATSCVEPSWSTWHNGDSTDRYLTFSN